MSEATTSPAPAFQTVALDAVAPSPTNPRKTFDKVALAELADSIKRQGVLQPILVRPWPEGRKPPKVPVPAAVRWEIVAGERRHRAAAAAGLAEIPAVVRELSDQEVLEIQVIENLQRSDLHPLEEAEGYRRLAAAKYDVARIAERIGRSTAYVYDRMKLLALTSELQQLFREGEITAGHAVILARLSPADQKRVLEDTHRGLFHAEATSSLFTDEEEERLQKERSHDPLARKLGAKWERKACSVRELQSWVNEHARLEADQVDPMLFPETVQAIATAQEAEEKVVRITYEDITPQELHGQPGKVILGRSWKRADGEQGSKRCPRAVLGYVVIGPGRGQAFHVCVSKKACEVHWGQELKAAKARERRRTKGGQSAQDSVARERARREAEERKENAERARWEKAGPALHEAFAKAVKTAAAGAAGPLAKFLRIDRREKAVPPGKTAEDLVRHMAFCNAVPNGFFQWARGEWAQNGKALGLDVPAIVDQVAPKEPVVAPATKKAAAAKAKGKKAA